MKRTQRNLFIIMAAMVAFYSIVTRLPWQAAVAVCGAVLLAFAALAVWGRDYLVASRCRRRRDWAQAIARYRSFERRLAKGSWRRAAIVLFLNVYTFDGVALARNNIGRAQMEAGALDEAVKTLRSALERDPQFALPYVHLATIAARRGDAVNARREMSRAVQLGFSPIAAERILRRELEAGG